MYLGNLHGLGAGVYVGTNFGTSECPAGWTRTNPGKWPVYCLPPAAPTSAPTSSPVNVVTNVNPTIATNVAPNISPVFQQQWQPSNSPATAGTTQAPIVPQMPGITSQAGGPAREVDYTKLFESLANQAPPQSQITATLPGGGTTVVEAPPRFDSPLVPTNMPQAMLGPVSQSSNMLPVIAIGGGLALLLLLRKRKK